MNSYRNLAGVYDELTTDVEYERLACYLESFFRETAAPVRSVLDLACGTGTLSFLLAQRGYEVIGTDASEEMLAAAAKKAEALPDMAERPFFIRQDMAELDLYGTVDACVCCLDSINHITDLKTLRSVFGRVFLFLRPGGIFLFDINSAAKLKKLKDGLFLDETEDVFCVLRTDYRGRKRVCTFALDLFRREGSLWKRSLEEIEEFAYETGELTEMLNAAGFSPIRMFGGQTREKPELEEERIFFCAEKPAEE